MWLKWFLKRDHSIVWNVERRLLQGYTWQNRCKPPSLLCPQWFHSKSLYELIPFCLTCSSVSFCNDSYRTSVGSPWLRQQEVTGTHQKWKNKTETKSTMLSSVVVQSLEQWVWMKAICFDGQSRSFRMMLMYSSDQQESHKTSCGYKTQECTVMVTLVIIQHTHAKYIILEWE